jgi:branched-chain amino acid transport system ATP-binding protein
MTSGGLAVRDLHVTRAGSPVVRGVDLDVPKGEVTTLFGANGAGKTTLLEALSGIVPQASGSIELDGKRIDGLSRASRARLGLAHVEQGRAIFPDLTAEENLLAAAPRERTAVAFELFPELAERRQIRASLLSGGEQQMLVIARSLLGDPEVLILDEMSLGLAPSIVKRLLPVVRRLADDGVAVLLVEQFAALAVAVGDRAYVMVRGEIAFEGSCSELKDDPDRLQQLYLGRAASRADRGAGPVSPPHAAGRASEARAGDS